MKNARHTPSLRKYNVSLKNTGRYTLIGIPLVWFLLLFLIPFIIVLKISFADPQYAIPPYTALTKFADQAVTITLNFANYLSIFSDDLYLRSFLSSLELAFFSTVLCLIVGYPIAYAVSQAPKNRQGLLILLIMLPSWTSFLVRIYAWMNVLSIHGLFNDLLLKLGIIHTPLVILNTNIAVYIGIVYSYLPYMILPIYTSLNRISPNLLAAASDLGARPFKAFYQVTLPLSKKGMIAGAFLVFIPAVGEVMIPQLLGGPSTLMIGNVLWQTFFNNNDWPTAASLAMIMLVILMIPIRLFNRMEAKELMHEAS